jgi:hypothetical protein
MINEIIAAISAALDAEFGDEYEIYMEEIKQDLKEPCFFAQCINPTTKLFRGERYFQSNPCCIQYFPKSEEIQRECNEVAERMTWCLEYITVDGDPMRGTQMHAAVVDGNLNFFVNYDCFLYRKKVPGEAMETVGVDPRVKG